MSSPPEKRSSQIPIRILSLDGGGIRGLSSLLVLRELMARISLQRGITPPFNTRPSECFDLIIGTGTGGISALFLGRMRMTVDEAIEEYVRVAETAFRPSRTRAVRRLFGGPEAVLDDRLLERSIGDVADRFLGDRNATIEEPAQPSTCRTAVLTSPSVDAPLICRSYRTATSTSQFFLQEVARATMTVGGLFPSARLGTPPVQFVNVKLASYINPLEIALAEVARLWPGSQVQVISIGVGLQKSDFAQGKWAKLIKVSESLARESEKLHSSLSQKLGSGVQYFRFQATDVHVKEWNTAHLKKQESCISNFLRNPAVGLSLDSCVKLFNLETLMPTKHNSMEADQLLRKFPPPHPLTSRIFHGHDDYIEKVVSMLLQDRAVYSIISGPCGIGKTSIALTIMHDSRVYTKYKEHCLFISCQGIISRAVLVDTICAAFHLQKLSADRQNDLLIFLSQTYTVNPLLLVLDNFETVWSIATSKVEEFLKALGQVTGISLLLTMSGTIHPGGLHWNILPIQPLSAVTAQNIFYDICGKKDDELNDLFKELDYVPLSVTLLAHLGQYESSSQLLSRWKTRPQELLSGSYDERHSKTVNISIWFSLNSPHMQTYPDALSLLSVLALLPTGVTDDLSNICPSITDCNIAAATLCHMGLAYHDSNGTLCLLSSIQLYVLKHHPLKSQLLHDLESYYFKLAALGDTVPGSESYHSSITTLHKVEVNMEMVLTRSLLAHDDDENVTNIEAIEAALSWSHFLYWTTPRDTIIQIALKVAPQNSILHAQCLQRLGTIQQMLHRYEDAQNTLSTAKSEFKSLDNHIEVAKCYQSLGDIQYMLGHYEQAKDLLSSAHEGFHKLDDKFRAAQCIQLLGHTLFKLQNYTRAEFMLFRAENEFEAIGNIWEATQCLQSQGNIKHELKDYEGAQKFLYTAQSEFEKLGDQLEVARCLQSIGDIKIALKDYKKAYVLLSTAKAEFENRGSKREVAQCLKSLGHIQYIHHDYEDALKFVSEARVRFEVIGDNLEVVQCLQLEEDIQQDHNNVKPMQSPKPEFQALRDRWDAACSLQAMAEDSQKTLQNYQQAQHMFSTAYTTFMTLGDEKKAKECLQSLAEIQRIVSNKK